MGIRQATRVIKLRMFQHLAHQLGFGLGQAAGLSQFVDARPHANQARSLRERQAGRVALF